MKNLILFIHSLAATLVAQTKLTTARAGLLVVVLLATYFQTAQAVVDAPIVSATKRDILLIDANGNALVSPGDTLRYTNVIINSGNLTATNVMFSDPLDPNLTLVPGSVDSSPIARNDSYSAIGNVSISVLVGSGLLVNDNDPDGGGVTVMSFQNPSANGGNVIVTNDGSFFYNPPAGFEGIDTFTYTISDGDANGFTDTAVVSITVSNMIWFIDDSVGAGDGRLSSPFNTIAAFNALNNGVPLTRPGTNDNIFLYSGNYTGPLTLLNGQRLIGQGAAQSISAITGLVPPPFSATLPATGGARPVIARTGGDNITLARTNSLYGLDVSASGGRGIFGSSVGPLTITNVASINTTNGATVDLANGALNVTVTNISANGGANGIKLTTTTGSFTVPGTGAANSGGIIQSNTGAGILLSSVANPSFTSMNIHDTGGSGIQGTAVSNFTFVNGTINNSGTALGADDSNIAFNNDAAGTEDNVSGNVTITNNTLSLAFSHGVDIINYNGTINNLNISSNTITSATSTNNSKGTAIRIQILGSASTVANLTKASINGNVIRNFPLGAGILVHGGNSVAAGAAGICGTAGSGTDIIAINGNRISGQSAANRLNTSGIEIAVNGKGQGNFDASNNSITNCSGTAIICSALGLTTSTATINNNVIVANNIFASQGIGVGTGRVATGTSADTPTLTVTINNNTISQTDGNGILAVAREATGHLNVTIKNNNVAAPLTGVRQGIRVDAGNSSSADEAVCLDISGNTSAPSVGQPAALGIGLRKEGTTSTINDFSIEGMAATSTPNVENYVNGLNPAGGGTLLISATSGFSNCSTAPLLAASGGVERATAATSFEPLAESAPPTPAAAATQANISTVIVDDGILDDARLQSVVGAAGERWSATGLSTVQNAALNSITFKVADLAGWYLASASPGLVQIDRDAAGHGWFIDPTPLDDSEFAQASSATRLYTDPSSAPAGRIDLLTTVMHEMGHVLGVSDSYSETARESLMYGSLTKGERRLPVKGQAKDAIPGSVTGTHFLTIPLTIGDLPPGKSVTIVFNTIVTNPFPVGVCQVTNQASISGANFSTVLTDDPDVGGSPNPTVTAVFIPPMITFCPPNVVTNTTGSCGQTVAFAATTEGCPPPVIAYKLGGTNVTSPFFFPVGLSTVSVTATNAAGTNTTCSFTVTVTDNEPPVLSCTNIIVSTASNLCSAVVAFTTNATDNCTVTNVTFTPPSGSTFPKGTNTVIGVATDSSGNTNGCMFLVIVNDTQKPDFTCPTNIVAAADSGACSKSNVTYSATATDNCDTNVSVTFSPPSGSTFNVGTNNVTASAVDSSGNSNGCTFLVIVLDTQVPAITCSSNIVIASTNPCVVVNFDPPIVSDNCVVTNFCSPTNGFCFPTGTNIVTCTAIDTSSNSVSCQFTITVIPCAVTCPTNIVVNVASNECSAVVTYPDPTTAGECSGTVTCVPASGSSFPTGTNTVTCTTTNGAGCSFTITVVEDVPPMITCPSNIVVAADAGQCSKSNVTWVATATDNCDTNVAVVCVPPIGSTFNVGTNNVTCTATDDVGNTNACSFTVTVVDMELPVINCSSNIIALADGGLCSKSNVTFTVTATDNCPGVGTPVCSPPSGSTFPKGTNTVNCSVVDATNNTNTCSFTVTVLDTQPPAISCSTNLVFDADGGLCSKSNVTFTVTATDNCDTNVGIVCVPPSGSTFPKGTNSVVCTATDSSSNTNGCFFLVIVRDTELPSITCSSNLVVTAGTNSCVAANFPAPTVSDNCSVATNFCSPTNGFCFPLGTNTVTCTAIDTSSNSASCTFTITVVPCSLICPSNIVVTNAVGQCGAIVTFTNTITGDCGTVTNNPPSGSFFPVGTTTVTASSSFGPTCTFTVTVQDTEKPVLTCSTNLVLATDPGQCTRSNVTYTVTATDNCTTNLTVVCNFPSGSTFPKGTTNVNCVVVDAAANTNSCSFTVTVVDLQPPAINCPSNQVLAAPSGQCVRSNVTFTVTANDNCDGTNVTIVCTPPSGYTFPVGTNTVVCTTSDAASNTNSCSFAIVVQDLEPPSITGASATPAALWPPNHKMRDVTINYTNSDNCGIATCVLSVTSNEPIDGAGDGDRAPDWEIVDDHHVRLRAERVPHGNGRIYTINISCTDTSGNSTTNAVYVVVAHNITAPASGASFKINTVVSFAGTFWDIPGNRHSAYWTFDNLNTSGSVTEPSGLKNGTVKGSYKFNAPGVYKVTMFVKDQTGAISWVDTSGDTEAIVVIYDPNGGYTIGSGWITSPPGAFTPDPSATGKLSFGFSSQYFKSAPNPKGEALVNFLVGDMEFNALNFDYLVISGAKAQFRGFGKINGVSGYDFILTVIDGNLQTPKGPDKFRLKIWEKISGTVIYDNEPNQSDTADPTTSVGDATSSILIKK